MTPEVKELNARNYKCSGDLWGALKRFKTGIHEGYLAPRAHARLKHLQKVAQPVTTAVYLRTLINGWPTYRRMRTLEGCTLAEVCPFCQRGQDSLEHFTFCKVIKAEFAKHGFLYRDREEFFGLDLDALPDFIHKKARLLCALYGARNTLVHSPADSPQVVLRLACQLIG